MEKTWVIKDADQHFYRLGIRRATEGLPFTDEKNPARAYTLSLFFWGGGQSYSGLRMRGVLYQICMFLFMTGIVLTFLFGKEFLGLLQELGISHADAFLSAVLLLLGVLIFWTYNAADAYHAAAQVRRIPFRGVRSRVLPMLSSLLLPGWGQYMNGQPLKGGLLAGFSVLGFFSLITVPAVLFFWPHFDPSPARSVIEVMFAAAVLYAPLMPVISLLSSYDALMVSLDDTKKETLLDRIVLALNRIQSAGWLRSAVPSLKSSIVFGLVLGSILVFKNHSYFPVNYYSEQLKSGRVRLQEQGMTLVPDLIGKLLSGTAAAESMGTASVTVER